MKLPPKEPVKRGVYSKKKIAFGIGINDADYVIKEYVYIDGKKVIIWSCPIHSTWVSMIGRCYSESYLQKRPTYRGCYVCDEWLIFSNFKRWMEQQDWEGKQLDKDILVVGNKVYSPDTCIFVDAKVNSFVIEKIKSRGKYMVGVCLKKTTNRFKSSCNNPFTHKHEHLGYYVTEMEAHLAWKARKHELACQLADSDYCNDPRLAQALRTRYNEQSDWTYK